MIDKYRVDLTISEYDLEYKEYFSKRTHTLSLEVFEEYNDADNYLDAIYNLAKAISALHKIHGDSK